MNNKIDNIMNKYYGTSLNNHNKKVNNNKFNINSYIQSYAESYTIDYELKLNKLNTHINLEDAIQQGYGEGALKEIAMAPLNGLAFIFKKLGTLSAAYNTRIDMRIMKFIKFIKFKSKEIKELKGLIKSILAKAKSKGSESIKFTAPVVLNNIIDINYKRRNAIKFYSKLENIKTIEDLMVLFTVPNTSGAYVYTFFNIDPKKDKMSGIIGKNKKQVDVDIKSFIEILSFGKRVQLNNVKRAMSLCTILNTHVPEIGQNSTSFAKKVKYEMTRKELKTKFKDVLEYVTNIEDILRMYAHDIHIILSAVSNVALELSAYLGKKGDKVSDVKATDSKLIPSNLTYNEVAEILNQNAKFINDAVSSKSFTAVTDYARRSISGLIEVCKEIDKQL